jgi:hypothetical protein
VEEDVEGKNGEWIWLWEAPTACVSGALCALARAIHGAGKRWGHPVANLGVIPHSGHRSMRNSPEFIGARHRFVLS